MSGTQGLQNSLARLLETLGDCNDPFQPQDIVARWTGLTARAGALARNDGAWGALPDDPPQAGAVMAGLDSASSALAGADYGDPASVKAALGKAESAVGALETLLGA